MVIPAGCDDERIFSYLTFYLLNHYYVDTRKRRGEESIIPRLVTAGESYLSVHFRGKPDIMRTTSQQGAKPRLYCLRSVGGWSCEQILDPIKRSNNKKLTERIRVGVLQLATSVRNDKIMPAVST